MSRTVTDSVRIGKAAMGVDIRVRNLPVVGTGIIFQITSNWLYRFTVFRPRISDSDGNGFLRRETVS